MKIKKVVIEGFRAYETATDGTFDFSTPSGKCADFVSIYAPNGFGKTSFYDAVEWALTNNIERFIRDATKNENDSNSKSQNQEGRRQHILRNKFIPDDAVSRVTVFGYDFDKKEKTVKGAKLGSRDYLFKRVPTDPGMEEVPGIFLSQEAIDGFLREEKPENRYARFMQHFGDDDEAYRAGLSAVRRELLTEIDELKEEESRLESILAAPVNANVFESINSTIAELVHAGESLSIVTQEFNSDDERQLRNTITKRSHEVALLVNELANHQTNLASAKSGLQQIIEAVAARAAAGEVVEKIRGRRALFEQYTALRRSIEALQVAVERERTEVQTWHDRAEKLPTFQALHLSIAEASQGKDATSRRLLEARAGAASLEQRISEGRRRLLEADLAAARLAELRENSPAIFAEIDAANIDAQEKQTQKAQLQTQIEALRSKLAIERAALASIEALKITEESFGRLDLTLLQNHASTSIELSSLELQTAILQKRNFAEQVTAAVKVLDTLQAQQTQLNALVTMGVELVSEGHMSQCPLCTHDHASHEILLNRLLNHPGLSDLEGAALQNKDVAQRTFNAASETVARLLEQWLQLQEAEALKVRESLAKNEAALNGISEQSKLLDELLRALMLQVEERKKDILNLSPAQLTEHISRSLDSIVQLRTTENADIKNSETLLAQRQQEIKDEDQALSNFIEKINISRANSVFVELSELCSVNAIPFESTGTFLTEKIRATQARAATLSTSLSNEQRAAAELELKSPELPAEDVTKIQVAEVEAETARLKAEGVLSSFLSKIDTLVPNLQLSWTADQIADGITIAQQTIRERAEFNTRLSANFELLSTQLRDVIPYVSALSARKELAVVVTSKTEREALNARIGAEYQETIRRLQQRVNGFFYTDLINSIYRKIDPHPDFKEVAFVCEFQEKGDPRLNVLVSDREGNTIVPNLYFSAAQVNILSLSIFLARALHVKACGKDVGCIFIDDPIHSMDSINVLSTIDLLRNISKKFNRQIILSTHDKNFFELLKKKIPEHEYSSRFIELESFGRVRLNEEPSSQKRIISGERLDIQGDSSSSAFE